MKARFSLVAAAVALCSPLVTWACINDSYVGPFEEGVLARYLPSWLLIIIPVSFFLGFCLFVFSRYLDFKEKLTFSEKLGTWEFLGVVAMALLLSGLGAWPFFFFVWGVVCFADSIMNFSLGRRLGEYKRKFPVILWLLAGLAFLSAELAFGTAKVSNVFVFTALLFASVFWAAYPRSYFWGFWNASFALLLLMALFS